MNNKINEATNSSYVYPMNSSNVAENVGLKIIKFSNMDIARHAWRLSYFFKIFLCVATLTHYCTDKI